MNEFQIWFSPAHEIMPVQVRKLGYDYEEDIFEFEVAFHHGGEEWHSTLTLDTSDWEPPVILDDSPRPFHQPKVFAFCHDGRLNYRQSQQVGEAIMRYLDAELEAAKGTVVHSSAHI